MKKSYIWMLVALMCIACCSCVLYVLYDEAHITPDEVDVTDFDAIHKDFFFEVFYSAVLGSTWDNPQQVEPDRLIAYQLIRLARVGKLGRYEGEPSDEVEAAIQKHFDVSVEHLRESDYYDEPTDTYIFTGWGGAAEGVITSAKMEDNRLTITYDVYASKRTSLIWGLSWGGELTVAFADGSYKYIANRKWYYEE